MSDKQKLARFRNFFKWRLLGQHVQESPFLTKRELELAKIINTARQEIIDNFTESSIKMGLNAKKRCAWCKNPTETDSKYCKKHKKELW